MEKTYRLFESTVSSEVELLLPEGKGEQNLFDFKVALDPELNCPPTFCPAVERCEFGLRLRGENLSALVSKTGGSVRLFPMPGVKKALLTDAFLGGILPTVLFFHGMLQLHASAVADDNGATCFCGVSGSGKSTTAAWYVANGFRLVDEDCPVLYLRDDQPYVVGHNRYFSLLPNHIHRRFVAKDWNSAGVRTGASGCPKERFVPPDNAVAPIAPLKRIVFLRNGSPGEIRESSVVRYFPEVLVNVKMSFFINQHYPERMFELIERCFAGVELLEVTRPDRREWWPQVEGLQKNSFRCPRESTKEDPSQDIQ